MRRLFLIEGIKDDALTRIDGGDFEHVAAADVANGKIGGVVEGAGRARRDSLRLKAGLGENEDLGSYWDIERVEQRDQIPEVAMIGHGDGAGAEPGIEDRGAIVGRGGDILDGGIIRRQERLVDGGEKGDGKQGCGYQSKGHGETSS
jgi:hypothetical protein